MNADIVIRDANIVTMTEPGQKGEAQAIAIRGGLIQAAGTNQEIEVMIGSDTQVLCLAGKMVLPGFIDTHVHFLSTGMGQIQPTISGMTKTDDILSVIDEKVRQAAPGEPVLVHGYDAGEVDRQLTKKDLEKLAPRNPLLVDDIGGHSCIANGKAIELINLPPNVLGLRPLENGEPSGVLVADANNIARYRYYGLMDDSIRVEAFNLAAKLANRYGITTIHALDGGSEDKHSWLPARDIDILLREQDNLPVRTVIYFQSVRVDMALDWNLPRIGGCVYIDGAYGEHTAALIEPYFDDPTSRGCLYFSDDELDDFVEKAHRAGLQISMHAIGDAAIEQLLSAYERTLVKYPRQDHRHRIEHFSLPTSDQIERVAGLGVAVAMQPNFAFMPEAGQADDYQSPSVRFLGPERYARRHPYRKIIDSGILAAGGSDADAGEIGILLGIHALVNHPDEERRLSLFEAIELYTKNAAKIAFEEDVKGTLEPGKYADLVVLGQDLFRINPKTILDVPVEMTITGGKVVFQA